MSYFQILSRWNSCLRPSPPSGIVFRYSWADLAENFRQCVCCANFIFCKFLVHKDCLLMSY